MSTPAGAGVEGGPANRGRPGQQAARPVVPGPSRACRPGESSSSTTSSRPGPRSRRRHVRSWLPARPTWWPQPSRRHRRRSSPCGRSPEAAVLSVGTDRIRSDPTDSAARSAPAVLRCPPCPNRSRRLRRLRERRGHHHRLDGRRRRPNAPAERRLENRPGDRDRRCRDRRARRRRVLPLPRRRQRRGGAGGHGSRPTIPITLDVTIPDRHDPGAHDPGHDPGSRRSRISRGPTSRCPTSLCPPTRRRRAEIPPPTRGAGRPRRRR